MNRFMNSFLTFIRPGLGACVLVVAAGSAPADANIHATLELADMFCFTYVGEGDGDDRARAPEPGSDGLHDAGISECLDACLKVVNHHRELEACTVDVGLDLMVGTAEACQGVDVLDADDVEAWFTGSTDCWSDEAEFSEGCASSQQTLEEFEEDMCPISYDAPPMEDHADLPFNG